MAETLQLTDKNTHELQVTSRVRLRIGMENQLLHSKFVCEISVDTFVDVLHTPPIRRSVNMRAEHKHHSGQ